jgi:hypothetical protein
LKIFVNPFDFKQLIMHSPGVELQEQQCRAAAKNSSATVAFPSSTHQQGIARCICQNLRYFSTR